MLQNDPVNVAAVRLEKVSFVKDGAGVAAEILREVSFSAGSGEITVIIGPSGGGKSSLIRLINRLAEPSAGTISLAGVDIRSLDPLELRRSVALVPQKPFMFEGSVLANLQRSFLYHQQTPPAAQSGEILECLTLARLEPGLLERDARSLSVGQQQRVSLARALIMRPRVLLLDEPTSALDRRTADALAGTLQDICRSRGLTVILVTHDLRLAERVADHCLYLEAGRILEEGRGAGILSRPATPHLRHFLEEPLHEEVS
ncbi:MAG TPA: ATP-binding cassette domain-containing protein [Geomonas sp.]|nr:ATP-binding cassette domain-containing protein [Geomonas sp.]